MSNSAAMSNGAGSFDLAALTARLIELSRQIATATEHDRIDRLAAALELACGCVTGARWASLTQQGERPKTPAASHELARQLDEAQYRTGSGPCLTALETGAVVVSEFEREHRWPHFVALARAGSPARGALSYPLAAAGHPGLSLNFYLDRAVPPEPVSPLVAAGFALVLTAINDHDHAHQLQRALDSNRLIGTALGILMTTLHVTSDQAFSLLRVTSQHTHRKLRDIADEVVFTGVLPRE